MLHDVPPRHDDDYSSPRAISSPRHMPLSPFQPAATRHDLLMPPAFLSPPMRAAARCLYAISPLPLADIAVSLTLLLFSPLMRAFRRSPLRPLPFICYAPCRTPSSMPPPPLPPDERFAIMPCFLILRSCRSVTPLRDATREMR